MKSLASYAHIALGTLTLLLGCQGTSKPPLETVDYVDIERFMGDWYVIAHIPTFLEDGAHNAVESYRLAKDGSIDTTFTFREGGFDGPLKRYNPTGFINDEQTNAVWGMQFIWPIKADYRVMFLDKDYTQTVIGRQKRDYVWIMARSPSINQADYQQILELLMNQGYNIDEVKRVPHRWN